MHMHKQHCQVGNDFSLLIEAIPKLAKHRPAACAAVLRALSCRAAYKRQLLSTEDGGTVALDWYTGGHTAKLPTHAPVVLVLHGLTGTFTNTLTVCNQFDSTYLVEQCMRKVTLSIGAP